MNRKTTICLSLLLISLTACGGIDYDHPQKVSERGFNRALASLASGSCTFEIDEEMNKKEGFVPRELLTAKVDFKNKIALGKMEGLDTDGGKGEAYYYYGENYVVNKGWWQLSSSSEVKGFLRVSEYESNERSSLGVEYPDYIAVYGYVSFNTNYSSYSFDSATSSYVFKEEKYTSVKALQFNSGRISRVFLNNPFGWYRLTNVDSTEIEIPDDIKEYGKNGPVQYKEL